MTLSSCDGAVLVSGITVEDGYGVVGTACLEAGLVGLEVLVDGGGFQEEISWIITFPSGGNWTGFAGSKSLSCETESLPSPFSYSYRCKCMMLDRALRHFTRHLFLKTWRFISVVLVVLIM